MDVQAYLCHDAIAESHPRGMAPAQTLPPLGTHRQDSKGTQESAHRLIDSMIVHSNDCACVVFYEFGGVLVCVVYLQCREEADGCLKGRGHSPLLLPQHLATHTHRELRSSYPTR